MKTTVNFHFQVQVSVDAEEGVELNMLQKRVEEQLTGPDFFGELSISASQGHVTNKRTVAEYRGMTLGGPVEEDRRMTADEMEEAEHIEMEADRLRAEAGPDVPMPSSLPETHQPSIVPR